MDEEAEKRKSSVELEMEKYLEKELGKLEIGNDAPLDLTVKKVGYSCSNYFIATTHFYIGLKDLVVNLESITSIIKECSSIRHVGI